MRFVWAVVAFVLATLLIGAGIAQRTLFVGPSSQEMSLETTEPAAFTLIDSEVLRTQAGQQTLIIRGEGELFAAYGRTTDLEAWLSDTEYNAITLGDEGEPVSALVTAEVEEESEGGETAAPSDDEEAAVGRNPAGSDLWLASFAEQDQIITDTQLPEGMSFLVARDGTQDAPDDIVVSWPLDNSTPLAGPLVAGGGLVLLIGIVLYILAIRHQRRGRGPRRKGPGPLPVTEPIDLSVESPADRAAIEGPAEDASRPAEDARPDDASTPAPSSDERTGRAERRSSTPRRRLAIPALALTAIMMTGCSADSWPQFGAESATPTPTPTVIAPENQKPPAVTEVQAARILQSISETLATADADLDIDLAATRLDGVALDARRTDYTLREKLSDRALPAAIPVDDIEILLPQANDGWPRTVLALTQSAGDDSVAPVILTMTQLDPWSNYKITDIAEMHASVELPEVAPAWLGTTLVPPDSTFLTVSPGEIGAAFSDVVDAGEKSSWYDAFDEAAIEVATAIQASRQTVVKSLADAGAAETSKTAFGIEPTDLDPVSLATLDSGAIVAVSFVETQTITPTSGDAAIRFGDNPEIKALTGVEESAKGVTTTYSLQAFFAVPTQGSGEQIRLLAVHQDILGAKVIK
ncbi:glycosyl transferase [Microbacterium sp. NPDC055903]